MARMHNSKNRKFHREEGSTLVEMALVSAFLFLPMLFGIIFFAYGLYVYNFVNTAARQATRYAAVRGVESCTIAPTFANCNLGPGGGSNPTTTSGSAALQSYVQAISYPGLDRSKLTVTATWLSKQVSGGVTSWSNAANQCVSSTNPTYTDAFGQPCNTPGDAVQVVVTYQYPLILPFAGNTTLNLTGVSQMVINE